MSSLSRASVLMALLAAAPLAAQPAGPREGCELCHGEVELLRQHVPSLEEARALEATRAELQASAHRGMDCVRCHSGYGRFPHTGERETRSCASCHLQVREVWAGSVHANPDREGATGAGCSSCHGVHGVLPLEEAAAGPGLLRANARCVACHETRSLPPGDPHADTVACASCHAPHATQDVDDPASSVAPHVQRLTCGSCHEEEVAAYQDDVHGVSLSALGQVGAAELALRDDAPPSCTSCHGGHDILAPTHPGFSRAMVEGCGQCHGDYADTYFGTYHGKATALGSEIVATCDQCHGSHAIYPTSDPRSLVSEASLVETCGACHEHARPAFVRYDSHPNPLDSERDPPLFYSFVFMNVVLVGVLLVFGLHTALWWVRLMIDRRKGIHHGIGAPHE